MSAIAYLDCRAGVSCEALLGALLDAGLSLAVLEQRLAFLPFRAFALTVERRRGEETSATTVHVTFAAQDSTGYGWSELEALLSSAQTPASLRITALAVVRRLMVAETKVRGQEFNFSIERTTLILLVAVLVGLEELGIAQLYVSTLPIGNGQMQATSPVTLELLHMLSATFQATTRENEGVSPIAAALLATIARFEVPPFSLERVGYGFNPASSQQASFLRLHIGKLQDVAVRENGGADTDWVTVLSTNIDNMSGELLGALMERLFSAGALDVSYTPLQMKKNRPAIMLMIVSPLEKGEELAYILLRETATLGVRIKQVQRLKAQRTFQQIETPLGPMLVKVKRLGSRIVSAAPEYEECQRVARTQNIPLADVYAVAQYWIAHIIINSKEK